jgi:hypothetical protein
MELLPVAVACVLEVEACCLPFSFAPNSSINSARNQCTVNSGIKRIDQFTKLQQINEGMF